MFESDRVQPPTQDDVKLGVIGLGYVGLPLAVAFSQQFGVVGFDIDSERINELQSGHDRTNEVDSVVLRGAVQLCLTDAVEALADVNTYVITTPTPVDASKRPDMRALMSASHTVATHLAIGDVVIYESTVYPGATEEVCVPVLESVSGLRYNVDFFVGYSPERINPGDKTHRFDTIVKVTSGSTPETGKFVDALYSTVVTAGTHLAPSIRVAEAAKVIENTQRDVNIALINELAMVFHRLGIDTEDVLEAAGTKWNFLPFRPGLVGGHCIGVDPYYLTHKAQEIGYHPELILSGRRLNDGMGAYVASRLIKTMSTRGIPVASAKVLILGLTFKENTPDLRNTRVVDIISELEQYGVTVDVHDPRVDPAEAASVYGIRLVECPEEGAYEGIVAAVAHREIIDLGGEKIRAFGAADNCVVFDLKGILPRSYADLRL